MAKPKTRRDDPNFPCSFLAGTAHLVHEVDKLMIVVLRGDKNIVGYLRSVDQFGNLVLHMAVERIYVGNKYGDIPRGVYIVRGQSVILLGEIDKDREAKQNLIKVSMEEILFLQKQELQAKAKKQELINLARKKRGIMPVMPLEDMF